MIIIVQFVIMKETSNRLSLFFDYNQSYSMVIYEISYLFCKLC